MSASDNPPLSSPRRGRPPVLDPQARRARILDALEEVYCSDGLEAATMDAVARRAGMSKRTVYASFEDRTALLRAWLDRMAAQAERPGADGRPPVSLSGRLRRILIPRPPAAGFGLPAGILRVLIAESATRPDIGREIVQRLLDRKRAAVLAQLHEAQANGDLWVPDASAMADLLLDMTRPLLLETLLDPTRQPDPEDLQARLALTLDLLLRAYGTGPAR